MTNVDMTFNMPAASLVPPVAPSAIGDLQNATPRDEWFAIVGDLGRDFGKGQKTMLDFMFQLSSGVHTGAIAAAEDTDASKDDLRLALKRFNDRAVRANSRAREVPISKVRLSELRAIMLASAMPDVDFPETLTRVSAEWDRKKKASIKRKQIDACYIDAAREQRKLEHGRLSDEAIADLTRKPPVKSKALAEIVKAFHDKMEDVLKGKNSPIEADDKPSFQAMLDACKPWFTPEQTAEEKAAEAVAAATEATARAANAEARIAALEAELMARVLPTIEQPETKKGKK